MHLSFCFNTYTIVEMVLLVALYSYSGIWNILGYNWGLFRAEKEKKQKVPRKNNNRHRRRRWQSVNGEYTQPSRNTTA